jgi:hypothetical protein
MSNAALSDKVKACVTAAIAKNERVEWVIVWLLVVQFITGTGLLVFGAVTQRWEGLVPGALIDAMLVLPLRQLMKLHRYNVLLSTVPTMLILAETPGTKKLATQWLKDRVNEMRRHSI